MATHLSAETLGNISAVCRNATASDIFLDRAVTKILPIALRAAASIHPDAQRRANLLSAADICESHATKDAAAAAADVAIAAETGEVAIEPIGSSFRSACFNASRLALAASTGRARAFVAYSLEATAYGDRVVPALSDAMREVAEEMSQVTLMAA